jgi:hypothetical protein
LFAGNAAKIWKATILRLLAQLLSTLLMNLTEPWRKNMKTFFAILLVVVVLAGVSFTVSCDLGQSATQDFAVETLAMAIGYELRTGFEWTSSVDSYYNAIMEGKMSLDAAQAAEGYLKKKTHPLIANRLVKLAGMVGFDFDAGKIIGVEKVNIHLLQVAAQGFRTGILLSN